MIFRRWQIAAFVAVVAAVGWRLYPDLYMQGLMYRDQGDRSTSIARFKDYLAAHPGHKGAAMGLVAAYQAAGDPDQAEATLAAFYRARRGDLAAGSGLLSLLESDGKYRSADDFRWELIADLLRQPAAGQAGLDTVLYEALQRAVAAQDDERALRALSLFATRSAEGPSYRDAMVRLLLARGLLARALLILRAEERAAPRDAGLRVMVTRVLLAQGDEAAARAELAAGLAALPYNAELLGERAAIAMKDKRWRDAEPDLRALMRIEPREDGWKTDLAECLIGSGRFDDGVAILERRRAAAPADPRRWWDVVYAYADHGRHAEAAAELSRLAARFPADREALDMLVSEEQLAGRPDLAVAALERRVAAAPGDIARRKELIDLLVGQEDLAGALSQAKALLALAPREPAVWLQAAALCETLRDRRGQVALLERYHALYPDDAQAMEQLADAYDALGERGKAIALFEAYFHVAGGAP